MKKVIFAMLLAISGCLTAMAGDDIKLTAGTLAPLKNGGVGSVTLDMKDTQFDNKMPLRQDVRFANIDSQLPECKSEFIREFNENAKKFRLTSNNNEAEYEFIVKITNFDTFVHVMSFKGGVGVKFWGTITIKNKKTGENVAVFKINEESNSGITYNLAVEEGFEGIAKFLAKKINKGK